MPNIQVKCVPLGGPQTRVTPGQSYDWLGGPQAEGIIATLHGRFYQQTYNQKLWAAQLTTAATIPINTTTNGITFAIWNPAGYNYAVVPVAFILGFVATNGIAGACGYYYKSGTGSDVATGASVSAFTAVSAQPTSGIVGQSYLGSVKVGSAATVGTAGTLARWSAFSEATPLATNTQGPYTLIEYFDGSMIIPPGVLWYPAGTAAFASTFMQTMIAYETPWP